MKNIILIISHRRSGTHLAIDSLRLNVKDIAQNFLTLEVLFPFHKQYISRTIFEKKLQKYQDEYKYIIIKTHLMLKGKGKYGDYKNLDKDTQIFIDRLFEQAMKIYIFRDGRDVMVSYYHYLNQKKIGDINIGHKKRDEIDITFFDFLQQNLQFWCQHVMSWIDMENVLTLSFENFAFNYENTLNHCLNFIGLDSKSDTINIYKKFQSYNSLYMLILNKIIKIGRTPKYSAIAPMDGDVGGWKNYFSKNEKDYFKQIAGDLLINLGYEKSFDW
jgi:hypothetical protein